MNEPLGVSVDLSQMVVAIETAVSLVGMNDTNHGKRVGYIALQMAHHLGLSDEEKLFTFQLGLLHDCGVSSDSIHRQLVNQFDWEESHKHSEIGYNLLKDFNPLKQLAIPIRYHHTRWDKLKQIDISFMEKRMANLIFLADRVEVKASPFYGHEILFHVDEIKQGIQAHNETFFDPELVDSFIAASFPEAFWLSLETRHITRFAWDMSNHGNEQKLSMDELKQLAKIFSYIVDQKSTFTAEHSLGVAKLCRHLAEKFGLTAEESNKLEVAGYLHDVGKLHVPDGILDKKGPLSALERAIINQHSYETYEILRPIKGLEEIAQWAAYHHEGCTNTGYPFHPTLEKFSLHARIVAVADVFQALVQDRPYRKGMETSKVIDTLNEMSQDGQLDPSIVETVVKDVDQCFKLAIGKS